jgi:hypothetical protein
LLRFHQSKRPPVRNYFSRREQWRLLLLVMSLGVVLFVMRAVRQPENVQRVARAFESKPVGVVQERRMRLHSSAETPRPEFPRDVLESIQDNMYFRVAEQNAWFLFLEFVQGLTREQIAAAPHRETVYAQLVDQPDFYRGKFVTVRGTVQQVTREKPAANEVGIESYYRVVVQPADGSSWPILVYCLEFPPQLREGDNTAGSMKVTGLFFKNLSYSWRGGVGIAPVVVAQSIEGVGSASEEPKVAARKPDGAVRSIDAKPQAAFRDVLALAEWDVKRLAAFDDNEGFSVDQRLEALHLLRRLRSFDSGGLEDWLDDGLAPEAVFVRPDEYRGRLVRLAGRVTKVSRLEPAPADAARLEMPEYFECELVFDSGAAKATVLTTRVPRAWLSAAALDEPASAVALYLKKLSGDGPSRAIWLAKEMAWHPTTAKEPDVSLGKSILGSLGMDVGLLDEVQSRGKIRGEEREAFYQMLDALGQIGTHQLARFAQDNLEPQRARWLHAFENETDNSRRAVAQEVVRRAKERRYSVAPLFIDPEPNIGQLFAFDGIARRAVRVEAAVRPEGGPRDVVRRFGFDHYYEIEVFTDDSQNYPLVFCVRELPEGFPTGGDLHVPIRLAGFFFKDWSYTARGTPSGETGDAAAPRGQFAPLLIGRSPLRLQLEEDGSNLARLVGACLFLLGLTGFGAIAWWFVRDDRRFSERLRTADFSRGSGLSLNELNLDAASEPIMDTSKLQRHIGEPP